MIEKEAIRDKETHVLDLLVETMNGGAQKCCVIYALKKAEEGKKMYGTVKHI